MLDGRSRKIDLLALALLALGLFLIVALATYSPADLSSPRLGSSTAQVKAANACGRSGAYASEALFRMLGWAAYFFVGSLMALDLWLLARRPVSEPVVRASGWLMSLVGVSTLLALAGPNSSPGPLIGPGGYLGAAGRALLEINFASTGAYILTFSVLLAGLLLCSDYLIVWIAATVLRIPVRATSVVTGRMLGRTQRADWSAEDGSEPAVRIRGKRLETASEDEVDAEEAGTQPRVKSLASTSDSSTHEDADDDESDEDGEDAPAAAKPGLRARLASALRLRRSDEREQMINELEEAAARTEEVFDYTMPSVDLLLPGETIHLEEHEKEVRQKAKLLEKTFADFGFKVKVVEIETGPVVAQYEVELEAGLRLSKITSLADDLAIALRVPNVRIVAPIPGKNTVGIEIPNNDRQIVRLREVIEETNGRAKKMRIPIYLGKDVAGNPMVVDLTTLPHLLIAGRTGTGKSVCLNSIIVSMLMTRSPNDVRMLLIDPKMVELSPYKRLPHLMHPVVTDMRKAEAILAWAVEKMEERYSLLARAGVRHISVYNQLGQEELMERLKPETAEERAAIPLHLPYIVIVADEMADLMMTAAKEVEAHIIRLAQKSRAVGIHLVLATQKPTVDVITGLIKSNLPARIAFQVASRVDSRVVLDEMGAERLLGNGDMLFLLPGTSTMLRGQGTYMSDDEINRVLDAVGNTKQQFLTELVQLKPANPDGSTGGNRFANRDELYEQAIDVVIREGRGSVSLLQRALGIGYGRAARLVDYMAEDGIVGEYNGSQAREVLLTLEQWAAMSSQGQAAAKPGPASAEPPPLPKPKRNRILLEPEPEGEDDQSFHPPPTRASASYRLDPAHDESAADDDDVDADAPWSDEDEEVDEQDTLVNDDSDDEDEEEAIDDGLDTRADSPHNAPGRPDDRPADYRRDRYTA